MLKQIDIQYIHYITLHSTQLQCLNFISILFMKIGNIGIYMINFDHEKYIFLKIMISKKQQNTDVSA